MKIRSAVLSLLLLFSLATPLLAGLKAGVAAYDAGNFDKALPVFRELAAKGDAEAQRYLGDMYDKGQGVVLDSREAAAWYLQAAEQGDPHAQLAISLKYALGNGVEQDQTLADAWMYRAADSGLAEVKNAIGLRYFKGIGLPKDPVQGLSWILRAEEQRLAAAVYYHEEFARQMTPEQIAAAYRMARLPVPGEKPGALQSP